MGTVIVALLVEDHPADAELISHQLFEIGVQYQTRHAATVAAAIDELARAEVDVVLLDLSLPDARGLEALRALRERTSLPIVVLTGMDDRETALAAVQAGAQDYLVKGTFDGDGLVRSVRYAIERARREEAVRTLAEERARREEAEKARRKAEETARTLDETNRGILALYAELDEKSDSLRRAAEVKSRVVSNVSHEFRTPLNAILGLVRLLLSAADGPLTAEQEKQLGFIQRSAMELSELVNDLLDVSQLEAGKVRLHAEKFEAADLFAALRGMSRPLKTREDVELEFFVGSDLPSMQTDQGKISQILRNLISNALKFTERGTVRISARARGGNVVFEVRDPGIGIAPEHHERIFDEFFQIDGQLQRQTKGTGLGLSLSRRLAELLGGMLTVDAALGEGSTFTLTVPAVHPDVKELQDIAARNVADTSSPAVLVLEDDRQTLFLYEKFLRSAGFRVMPSRSVEEARAYLTRIRPAAIVLDVMLEGETSWQFLSDLKSSPATRDIPTLVVTVTDRENKARALGADEFWMKPLDQEWLLSKLQQLSRRGPIETVLVIDDDEVSRYLVRRLLHGTPYRLLEATGGIQGVNLARTEHPSVILLDFVMPGMSAFEVLDELKVHPDTRDIPVIIHTVKELGDEERQRLAREAADILNKQNLTREVAIGRIRDALAKAGVARTKGS